MSRYSVQLRDRKYVKGYVCCPLQKKDKELLMV